MKKILIGCGVLIALGGVALFGLLLYLGTVSPETFVVSGKQMRKHQYATIREMGLLEDGEKIQYFYSDGLLSIREGMYFVTDRKVVLYCESWEDPQLLAPFEEIVGVDVEYEDSFFLDGYIHVEMNDGYTWTFPVSSEKGMDKVFFEYLSEKVAEAHPEAPGDDHAPASVEPAAAAGEATGGD